MIDPAFLCSIDPSLLTPALDPSLYGEVEQYWVMKPWWVTATAAAFAIAGLLVGWSVGRHGSIFFRSRQG